MSLVGCEVLLSCHELVGSGGGTVSNRPRFCILALVSVKNMPQRLPSFVFCLPSLLMKFRRKVHERDLQTDFLLSILRDLLPKRPELRVVLMSATLQARGRLS